MLVLFSNSWIRHCPTALLALFVKDCRIPNIDVFPKRTMADDGTVILYAYIARLHDYFVIPKMLLSAFRDEIQAWAHFSAISQS